MRLTARDILEILAYLFLTVALAKLTQFAVSESVCGCYGHLYIDWGMRIRTIPYALGAATSSLLLLLKLCELSEKRRDE